MLFLILSAVSFAVTILSGILAFIDLITRQATKKRQIRIALGLAGCTFLLALIFFIVGYPSLSDVTSLLQGTPSVTPSSQSTPSVTNCGATIESKSPENGGPPYYQLNNLIIKLGCVGILIANSGNVDGKQWDQHGGLIALPEGNYSGVFTDGEIVFSPSPQANTIYCKLYNDSRAGGHPIRNVWPLSGWHTC